jgi:lycopene cyclase domain-containing protein
MAVGVTYSAIASYSVILAIILDLFVIRSAVTAQWRFYFAWAILLVFQLLTNGWLTGRGIVQYDESQITGVRLANAPVEDIAFGFALIVVTLSVWLRLRREKTDGSDSKAAAGSAA